MLLPAVPLPSPLPSPHLRHTHSSLHLHAVVHVTRYHLLLWLSPLLHSTLLSLVFNWYLGLDSCMLTPTLFDNQATIGLAIAAAPLAPPAAAARCHRAAHGLRSYPSRRLHHHPSRPLSHQQGHPSQPQQLCPSRIQPVHINIPFQP